MATRKLSFPKNRELRDIERYLKREILRSYNAKGKEDEKFPLVIRTNNNTMRSEIKYPYRINFAKLHNIVSLLRFSSNHVLESDMPINIINVNIICFECNLCDRECILQQQVRAYDTRIFAERTAGRYRKDRHRSFTFRSYGTLRI